MRTGVIALAAGLVLPLSACGQNTAPGNDREARLDSAPTPAQVAQAADALRNIPSENVKPGMMTGVDIQAIGGMRGRCAFRLTEASYPTFIYRPGGQGVIKLADKLIPVTATGPDRFVGGELLITTRAVEETGSDGLRAQELIVVPPDAKDELGYRGYAECLDPAGQQPSR